MKSAPYQWALKNPRATERYFRLLGLYRDECKRITEKEQYITALQNGGAVEEDTGMFGMSLFKAFSFISFDSTPIMAGYLRESGVSETDIEEWTKQAQIDRWEREATEAEKKQQEKREREIETTRKLLEDYYYKQRDKYFQMVADYTPSQDAWDWCNDGYAYQEELIYPLNERLYIFGLELKEDFEDVCLRVAINLLDLDLTIKIPGKESSVIATIGDSKIHFTVSASGVLAASMLALLIYLDHEWGDLVERYRESIKYAEELPSAL